MKKPLIDTSTMDSRPEAPSSRPEYPSASANDFACFAWQKLNALDASFVKFAEIYGRLDERLAAIDRGMEKTEKRLDAIDGRLSEIGKDTASWKAWRKTTLWFGAAIFTAVIGLLVADLFHWIHL